MYHNLKIKGIVLVLSGLSALLNSCEKKEVPVVFTTPAVTNITGTTATCGGTITDAGSGTVHERGVCWSTEILPTISDNKSYIGSGPGTFETNLTDLTAATVYYVRAFAVNDAGVGYGVAIPFKTLGKIPTATTLAATGISTTSAIFNAEVNANFLSTDVFFEYGTTTNYGSSVPILQNPLTGNTTTKVSVNITALLQGTIYHFRVKTVNSLGTAYGNDISFITLASDVDGNIYNVISLGNQLWMGENLKTTKYKDGTAIPIVTDGTKWAGLTTSAYCWYDNSIGNKNVYGALYNWYTVKTGKLCPAGWHVPTDAEWTVLTNYLGGESVAGGKLKEKGTLHWASPNTGATNESRFTALPGGCRRYDGVFIGLTGNATWRTSSDYDATRVMYRFLFYYSGSMNSNYTNKQAGYSVRCLKD